MKLHCHRTNIEIVPENAIEIAYLEEVLGFRNGVENPASVCRVNGTGLSAIYCIQIRKREDSAHD